MGGCLSDPEESNITLRVNGGHASARRVKQAPADSGGANAHSLACVDEALEQCVVCGAFEKAPRAPIGGTPTVSMFNEKLQVDLLFLGDIIASRVTDVFSDYFLLLPVRSENPHKVWDACCNT